MKKKFILFVSLLVIAISYNNISYAQCSMCAANAEANEAHKSQHTVMGLNMGIMYIMLMPYLVAGGIGFWWYRNNKKKST